MSYTSCKSHLHREKIHILIAMSYNPLQLAAILATLKLRGVLDYWILVKSGEYVCNCQSTNRKKNLWPYIKRDMPTTQIALCLFNTAMENCPIIDDVCWFTFKHIIFQFATFKNHHCYHSRKWLGGQNADHALLQKCWCHPFEQANHLSHGNPSWK